jgi:hypothetical protein
MVDEKLDEWKETLAGIDSLLVGDDPVFPAKFDLTFFSSRGWRKLSLLIFHRSKPKFTENSALFIFHSSVSV